MFKTKLTVAVLLANSLFAQTVVLENITVTA